MKRCRITCRMLVTTALLALIVCLAACQTPNRVLRKDGAEAYRVGDIATADAKFAQAVDQHDTDWKSLWYLGKVRLSQQRNLDAQLLLEKAYALRATHDETPEIIDDLAEALVRQEKHDLLADLLSEVAMRYGTVYDYLREGEFLARAGDVDSAKVAYLKALRFADRNDPEPYIAFANFLESVGDTEGALHRLRQAYYISPTSSGIAERFRRYGIVPGPTVGVPPERYDENLEADADW